MDYYRAFPFFMGYQGYGQWAQPGMATEEKVLEDLEYLQQMYPEYSKKYQSMISSAIDKMDYEGSFIYDQYPDKFTIQRMVESIMVMIKADDEKQNMQNMTPNPMLQRTMEGQMPNSMPQGMESQMMPNPMSQNMNGQMSWKYKEPWIRELVTVLMYYEILTRRRRKNKYWKNISF